MNDIVKYSKNYKMMPKTLKKFNFKTFKMSCKEASNEKIRKQTTVGIENIKNVFFTNF